MIEPNEAPLDAPANDAAHHEPSPGRLIPGHPTIDTSPCVFGHYEVRATEWFILGPDGMTPWQTSRICMRCSPVSAGVWKIKHGGGIEDIRDQA